MQTEVRDKLQERRKLITRAKKYGDIQAQQKQIRKCFDLILVEMSRQAELALKTAQNSYKTLQAKHQEKERKANKK